MADDFTPEQKEYLAGFAVGANLAARVQPTFASTLGLSTDPLGPKPAEHACYEAQDRTLAAGKKLNNEEQAKRKRFPLDQWDDIVKHARDNTPPKGTDVLALKYFGLFWVAPAQDSFMSRLRFPGGFVRSYQLAGVADLADTYGGGFADITTRANLQVREIKPNATASFLEGLYDLGIVNRGSGADNIRNITASPLAGIDPQELIDTLPLARQLNTLILNHRELFGLPRKFNIAFDGGGRISALEDTNDIGFTALRASVARGHPRDEILFRLTLGGITGHKDFARDTGIAITPEQCIPVSVAVLKAFIEHGDRTDRKKARLKYVLDRMGFDGFVKEIEKHLGSELPRVPLDHCEPRSPIARQGHVGWHDQRQPGLSYAGIIVPAGRLSSDQLRGIADLASRFGSGNVRLTVWQNLILPDIKHADREMVESAFERLGLTTRASSIRAGLVACTGNAGCKFANTNTKLHALALASTLDSKVALDAPVNIHFTGCPHSCAQHYIGDIGLLGTKVAVGEEMVEGYHMFVGGGYGTDQSIARELLRNVKADDLPSVIERLLQAYSSARKPDESFNHFVRRHEIDQLAAMLDPQQVASPVEAVI